VIIIGLNAYHGDSSACLVINGKLVCAIEEERIRRIKHWAGLPIEAIKWCLKYGGVDIKDVDYIAISRNPYAHIGRKIIRVLSRLPKSGFIKGRLQNMANIKNIKSQIAEALGADIKSIKAKLEFVEHHRAHIGSSFLVSPYEKAVCITIDGFGDFMSCVRAIGEGTTVNIVDGVYYPHSLGIFYTAFTQFLGFPKYGDEYKVMGLSALGEPVFVDKMMKIIRVKHNGLFELDTSYFVHDSKGVEMTWLDSEPYIGRIFSPKVSELFGEPREKDKEIGRNYADIAASMQRAYEEVFFHILNNFHRKEARGDKVDKGGLNLCLAGGCIQNSLANGKIYEKTHFKKVYIPPASHDAGTAIGAAFWVWNVLLGKERDFVMENPYWGPEYTEAQIEAEIDNKIDGLKNLGCLIDKINDRIALCKKTAKAIEEGKIVGWFQGRTEWGPRALGNRSILVDPRRKEMKDILNTRIKRREWFRPFAPSILEEHVSEWFEESYPVPFMEKVYKIKAQKREFIPAVTHIDGTGRLQTVSKTMNPLYYDLISEFHKLTGVPIVLNTSFNENEPIVNTPSEAIECFLRTRMDVLVVGNFYIKRKGR